MDLPKRSAAALNSAFGWARQWCVALLSARYTTTTQPAKFATYLSTQVTTQRVCRLSLRNDDQTFADPDFPCPCRGKLAQRPAGQIGTRRTDGDHTRFPLPVYGLNRQAQQADVRRIRRFVATRPSAGPVILVRRPLVTVRTWVIVDVGRHESSETVPILRDSSRERGRLP